MHRVARSGLLALLLMVLSIILSSAGASARVWYVKPGATGGGTSWNDARGNLQAAIDFASSGDEIWVAQGTYTPLYGNLRIKAGISVYGGFAGAETLRNQRNWNANVTILEGDRVKELITMLSGDPNRIDGFTLRKAGTVVYVANLQGVVANNLITGNTCSNGSISLSGGSPTVVGNTILGNRGTSGGIRFQGVGSPVIVNNVIAGNAGNAIDGSSATYLTVSNNIIQGNGGGIRFQRVDDALISNNTIVANGGPGVWCLTCAPTISSNIVAYNAGGVLGEQLGVHPALRKNCVYGNTQYNYRGVTQGTTDIIGDPRLASRQYGNVHIEPGSPCINAGDNADIYGDRDIDGQSRVWSATVDVGADESYGETAPAGPYTVVYVGPYGDDANSGTSWASAKKTIQAAVDAASLAGGEVWVMAGTYKERFTLMPYAYVYGGFAGTETEKSQRIWATRLTILDGQQGGTVVTARAGEVVSALDGFVVQNGKGQNDGGGIYCNCASPLIAHNRIVSNVASNYGHGGGICCQNASPVIHDNLICANSAQDSPAIYLYGSAARICNNTVVGNAETSGFTGAIYCYNNCSATIANNVVALNSSGVYADGGNCVLRNNCLYGNTGPNYGGSPLPLHPADLDADPRFVDITYGSYRLQPDSTCINAGSTADALGDHELGGGTRVQGSAVDIGAYESDGATSWPNGPYAVIYVASNGNDANSGLSWDTAVRTIQAGVDRASLRGGDVWVKAGIYSDRIVVKPHAHLYGGFSGTETLRAQRDWVANASIQNGPQGLTIVNVAAGAAPCTVDGFTIRNGKFTVTGDAAIYCPPHSSPTIRNNTLIGNNGVSIRCYYSSPNIIGNTFSYNSGGSSILCDLYSSPSIIGNTLLGNSAPSGAGVRCNAASKPVIANNVFKANGADNGAAIYCDAGGPWICNNTIVSNTGTAGAALYLLSPNNATVTNNLIACNSSGIYGTTGTVALRSNCVYGNQAYDYSGIARGATDISLDPRLADRAYGDIHIQPDSPCIDAGESADVRGDSDMDGQARLQGANADIGADESDGAAWSTGPSAIVRVKPAGNDSNDGTSWASAKQTVQAAVDAASAVGGEVWVQAGTYNGCVNLKPYAYVYGGFVGTELEKSERRDSPKDTVLDGQQAGSVVTAIGGHAVSALDGFEVRNGKSANGAGINCTYGSPAIVNCILTGNTATGSGGGLYLSNYFQPLSNLAVTGNAAANSGGGIHCVLSTVDISNCVISANTAATGGGLSLDRCTSTVAGSLVSENTSTGSGAGISISASSCTVSGNVIADNLGQNSYSSGGGVRVWNSGTSPVVIANNQIRGNRAASGAGMHAGNSLALTISGNRITGNTATSDGGGLNVFGGTSGTVLPCISGNLIAGNSSRNGAGAYLGVTNSTLAANTITGNTASGLGGGIYMSSGAPVLTGNILAFNSSSGIYNKSGTPVLSTNCVYGNSSGDYSGLSQGVTDIVADPRFVDRTNGDYRLSGSSPCIDAGTNTGAPATDFDGSIRPQDGDGNGFAVCDIGAFEAPLNLGMAGRNHPDGSQVVMGPVSVTACFPPSECIYVEKADRNSGIRVDTASAFPEGQIVSVSGTIQTDPDTGERYIQAAPAYPKGLGGSLFLRPIGMPNKYVGGRSDGLVPATFGACGLNNLGLLVRTWGRITETGAGWCRIDDGTADGIKVVLPLGVSVDSGWDYVALTGISSCEKDGDRVIPVIKVRKLSDITPL